ncbi:hypothetical protein [Janibacter massiliensis]|uniref:hypothetical protein n=1 Tax=Janibacter massiliensis TaxID=2058291 RepID=UPI000D10A941|nr:hypothetical protein [Janibacter massiliensis]
MTDSPIDHLGTGMPGTSPAHDLDLGDDHDATGQEMEARALEAEQAAGSPGSGEGESELTTTETEPQRIADSGRPQTEGFSGGGEF